MFVIESPDAVGAKNLVTVELRLILVQILHLALLRCE
jgi:hypothetical protein